VGRIIRSSSSGADNGGGRPQLAPVVASSVRGVRFFHSGGGSSRVALDAVDDGPSVFQGGRRVLR